MTNFSTSWKKEKLELQGFNFVIIPGPCFSCSKRVFAVWTLTMGNSASTSRPYLKVYSMTHKVRKQYSKPKQLQFPPQREGWEKKKRHALYPAAGSLYSGNCNQYAKKSRHRVGFVNV